MNGIAFLCNLHADGKTTQDQLEQAGYATVELLARAEPDLLAQASGIPVAVARRLVDAATRLPQPQSNQKRRTGRQPLLVSRNKEAAEANVEETAAKPISIPVGAGVTTAETNQLFSMMDTIRTSRVKDDTDWEEPETVEPITTPISEPAEVPSQQPQANEQAEDPDPVSTQATHPEGDADQEKPDTVEPIITPISEPAEVPTQKHRGTGTITELDLVSFVRDQPKHNLVNCLLNHSRFRRLLIIYTVDALAHPKGK